MGGNPNAGRQYTTRPSPLQQVSHTRPLSSATPTNGLVRDPLFWKRFSVAVHAAEVTDEEAAESSVKSGSTVSIKNVSGDDWLGQQRKEKRRCRINCVILTIVIMILIAGGAFAGWYFTHHPIKL